MEESCLLRTENISKEFSQVRVLSDVNFDLKAGEIHALIGENGAGKSTFIKIISGVYSATTGRIFIDGKEVAINSTTSSEKEGIFTIHQEINLVPYFNAYENIFIGNELTKRCGLLDKKAMAKKAEEILDRLDIHININKPVRSFNTSIQRIIQISQALVYNPKILIFDEPTTALGEEERVRLLQVIKDLRSSGIGIIFISHNIEEIVEIADRVTVFKDGLKVGTLAKEEIDSKKIVRMMIGNQDYEVYVRDQNKSEKEEVLRVEKLCNSKLKEVSLILHRGEILGIAGVVGAGKTELARAIFGIDSIDSGRVFVNGKEFNPKSYQAVNRGLGFVPEERRIQGLVSDFNVSQNISLAYLKQFAHRGFMDKQKENKTAEDFITKLSIKTTGPRQLIKFLSGGNQQKVVLSKWLTGDFQTLIMDEPTKGIDVMSKRDIYKLVNTMVQDGKSVLFMSSYLPELLNVCDRIIVMIDGRVVEEFSSFCQDAKQEITHVMLGGK